MSSPPAEHTTLRELALMFLRLGTLGFGGPAAHIAMMRDEVVTRRKWMSDERFVDLLSATNLIPGPNSTEMALHIGWQRRRLLGLIVAGLAFILPAMLITMGCAVVYLRYGKVPAAHGLMYGVKPVILGVVVQAIWGLVPTAAKNTKLRVIGIAATALLLAGAHELLVLFGCGALAMILAGPKTGVSEKRGVFQLLPIAPVAAAATAVTLPGIFGVFFKIGSVLFGSGYVLLSFLQADLVERLGWLSREQLLDAVAVGQITPGPVFTTATFIGYILAGTQGALVATAGIFLPAFLFVALSGPIIPRLRASCRAAGFLDGLNVASVALMLVVTLQLANVAIVDAVTVGIGALSAFVLVRFKTNPSWLVLGGAAAGLLAYALRA